MCKTKILKTYKRLYSGKEFDHIPDLIIISQSKHNQ